MRIKVVADVRGIGVGIIHMECPESGSESQATTGRGGVGLVYWAKDGRAAGTASAGDEVCSYVL